MVTKLEALKAKLEKAQKAIEEMTKQVESETLAELKTEEFMQKSASILTDIAVYALKSFSTAGLTLPEGRVISFTPGLAEDKTPTLIPSMTAPAPKKTAREGTANATGTATGGARHTIKIPAGIPELSALADKDASWADVADALGIPYGAGSAHKAVFDKNQAVHDQIPHDACPYTKPVKA
jgi:hypothetical protein